jgi:hypothetical protein
MAKIEAESTKAKLRRLREVVAFEARRAQGRENAPPELIRRLLSTAELLNSVCLLTPGARSADELEEVWSDALVEAHLVLHDWERWRREDAGGDKPRAARAPLATPVERRQSARQDVELRVTLRRYEVHAAGAGAAVEAQTRSLPARNLSTGGLFVSASAADLPKLEPGAVVLVTLTTSLGDALGFRARAVVARRDAAGLGLRWVDDSEPARRAIAALLDAMSARAR